MFTAQREIKYLVTKELLSCHQSSSPPNNDHYRRTTMTALAPGTRISKRDFLQSHIVRQNKRARLIFACMLHPSMSYRAGWSYIIHGWLDFIHLRHWAALSKPHCAYTQKLGTPVCSTLLYDFELSTYLQINTRGTLQKNRPSQTHFVVGPLATCVSKCWWRPDQ